MPNTRPGMVSLQKGRGKRSKFFLVSLLLIFLPFSPLSLSRFVYIVPIRLSYHDGNHYNAVIDPLLPTAGLGLGLPGLKPGLADTLQMAQAVKESDAVADQKQLQNVMKSSEDDELQRAIKESKLSADYVSSIVPKYSCSTILRATRFLYQAVTISLLIYFTDACFTG